MQQCQPLVFIQLSVAQSLAPSRMQHDDGALAYRIGGHRPGLMALDWQGDTSHRDGTNRIQ